MLMRQAKFAERMKPENQQRLRACLEQFNPSAVLSADTISRIRDFSVRHALEVPVIDIVDSPETTGSRGGESLLAAVSLDTFNCATKTFNLHFVDVLILLMPECPSITSQHYSGFSLTELFQVALHQAFIIGPATLRPGKFQAEKTCRDAVCTLASMIPLAYFEAGSCNIVDRILLGTIKFFWTYLHNGQSLWGRYFIPRLSRRNDTWNPSTLGSSLNHPQEPQHQNCDLLSSHPPLSSDAPVSSLTTKKRKREEHQRHLRAGKVEEEHRKKKSKNEALSADHNPADALTSKNTVDANAQPQFAGMARKAKLVRSGSQPEKGKSKTAVPIETDARSIGSSNIQSEKAIKAQHGQHGQLSHASKPQASRCSAPTSAIQGSSDSIASVSRAAVGFRTRSDHPASQALSVQSASRSMTSKALSFPSTCSTTSIKPSRTSSKPSKDKQKTRLMGCISSDESSNSDSDSSSDASPNSGARDDVHLKKPPIVNTSYPLDPIPPPKPREKIVTSTGRKMDKPLARADVLYDLLKRERSENSLMRKILRHLGYTEDGIEEILMRLANGCSAKNACQAVKRHRKGKER